MTGVRWQFVDVRDSDPARTQAVPDKVKNWTPPGEREARRKERVRKDNERTKASEAHDLTLLAAGTRKRLRQKWEAGEELSSLEKMALGLNQAIFFGGNMVKPKGRPGDWFAEWEGAKYPCVHNECLTKLHYRDPFPEKVAQGKFDRYAQAIQNGKVIVTKSKPHPNGHLSRDHYVALWEVADVVIHPEQGIEFDLVARIKDWPRTAN